MEAIMERYDRERLIPQLDEPLAFGFEVLRAKLMYQSFSSQSAILFMLRYYWRFPVILDLNRQRAYPRVEIEA